VPGPARVVVFPGVNLGQTHEEITVPESGARNIFIYLLTFLNLYFSAAGLILLTWGLGNQWFADPLQPGNGAGIVRAGISMVVIAFPVFLYLARYLRRRIDSDRSAQGSFLRQVLTNLTMFVLAITVIGDVITVIYLFLGGDLTARFAVRGAGILLTVGLVLLYYLGYLRRPPEPATA
jgi:hypothetical protein